MTYYYTSPSDTNPHLLGSFTTPQGQLLSTTIASGLWTYNIFASSTLVNTNPISPIYIYSVLYYTDGNGNNPIILADGSQNLMNINSSPLYNLTQCYTNSVFVNGIIIPNAIFNYRLKIELYAVHGNPVYGDSVSIYFRGNTLSNVNSTLWASNNFVDTFSVQLINGRKTFVNDVTFMGQFNIDRLNISGNFTVNFPTTINSQFIVNETVGTAPNANGGSVTISNQNPGGSSSIVFPSNNNFGTDYGYIRYMDDVQNNSVNNNSRMVIGVESTTVGNGQDSIVLLADNGRGKIGVNNMYPNYTLDVSGTLNVSGIVNINNPVAIVSTLTASQNIEPIVVPTSFSFATTIDFTQGMINYMSPTSIISSLSIINVPITPLKSYSFAFIFSTANPYYIAPSTGTINVNGAPVVLSGTITISSTVTYTYIVQQVYLVNRSSTGIDMFALTSATTF